MAEFFTANFPRIKIRSADNLNIGAMQSNGGTSACDVSDFHLIKFNNFNGFFVVSVCIHINVCVCVGVSRF